MWIKFDDEADGQIWLTGGMSRGVDGELCPVLCVRVWRGDTVDAWTPIVFGIFILAGT